jgi:hypothetical protein
MIAVLPFLILLEGHKKLKTVLANHGYNIDWTHTTLLVLILVLIVLLFVKYGY